MLSVHAMSSFIPPRRARLKKRQVDSAMSERRSILRSVDTLSEHIFELQSK